MTRTRPPSPQPLPRLRPATTDQIAQIKVLLEQLDGPIADVVMRSMGVLEMSEPEAAKRLRALQLRKRVIDLAVAATKRVHDTNEDHIPLGLHARDELVYRVRTGAASRLRHVEVLDLSIHRFMPVGRQTLDLLGPDTLLSRTDAEAYGRRWGVCVRCGIALQGSSAQAGMGPTCAKRWNQ